MPLCLRAPAAEAHMNVLRLDVHFPYLGLPLCSATARCAAFYYPKKLGGGYVDGVPTPARWAAATLTVAMLTMAVCTMRHLRRGDTYYGYPH